MICMPAENKTFVTRGKLLENEIRKEWQMNKMVVFSAILPELAVPSMVGTIIFMPNGADLANLSLERFRKEQL